MLPTINLNENTIFIVLSIFLTIKKKLLNAVLKGFLFNLKFKG